MRWDGWPPLSSLPRFALPRCVCDVTSFLFSATVPEQRAAVNNDGDNHAQRAFASLGNRFRARLRASGKLEARTQGKAVASNSATAGVDLFVVLNGRTAVGGSGVKAQARRASELVSHTSKLTGKALAAARHKLTDAPGWYAR